MGTLNLKRHVSATPVPSSVCGWNNNDEQYIAENQNNNGMIQQQNQNESKTFHSKLKESYIRRGAGYL